MTNIFPYEALAHYLDNDSIDINDKKAVKKILTAQINYEFRDAQLSLYARYNKSEIFRINKKRYIKFYGETYPYNRSSPHKLINLIQLRIDGKVKVNGQLFGRNELFSYQCNSNTDNDDSVCLFFCSQEYTQDTGIFPKLIKDYKTCIKMYIDYIQWKLDNKKEK